MLLDLGYGNWCAWYHSLGAWMESFDPLVAFQPDLGNIAPHNYTNIQSMLAAHWAVPQTDYFIKLSPSASWYRIHESLVSPYWKTSFQLAWSEMPSQPNMINRAL